MATPSRFSHNPTPPATHLPGNTPLVLNPSFDGLQKINVYATKPRIYIVGCNQERTRFRVLKIDRTEQVNLDIIDDGIVYNREEIEEVLMMIDASGGTKNQVLHRKVSAFGIFGFVRFLLGYYLVLITSRRRVAMIGTHIIYKIEDTLMIPMFNNAKSNLNPSETKYLKTFQNVDISSNFYYSYSYDITQPLQVNMHVPSNQELSREAAPKIVPITPDLEYVWNNHLLQPFKDKVHPNWVLYCIHGFVAQSNLSIFGRSTYVTVIARRSRQYAGTRFLKRGTNDKGYVANAIESEQIVHDASTLSHANGRYTSFLQYRGSIPVFWAQDHSGMKAKPPISMARIDPFASAAALHFDRLFRKYGSKITVLNLVKKNEKKPRESILSGQLAATIRYLNQSLPERHKLLHQAWDMAKCAKSKTGNVLRTLEEIASGSIRETGFFHAGPQPYVNALHSDEVDDIAGGLNYASSRYGRHQQGILRVNCVDCLDRTNTAQFMLGLCALRHQLHALGLLEKPSPQYLPFDSAACRLLEELYEDHGDTIALQYGGSQLVNRIQTYRKSSPWTTHSRDILNTVARYYSNSFTDAEKQMAINVFLGVYQPANQPKDLWTLDSDAMLHNHPVTSRHPCPRPHYINWFRTHLDERPLICQFRTGGINTVEGADALADPLEGLSSPVSPSFPRSTTDASFKSLEFDPEDQEISENAPPLYTNLGPLTPKLLPQPTGVNILALGRRDVETICEFTVGNTISKLRKAANPKEQFAKEHTQLLVEEWGVTARSDPQLRVTGALIVAARHGVHWSPLTLPPTPRPRQPKNKRLQWVYHGAHYSAKSMTSFDHVYPLRMTTTARLTAADGISPFKVLDKPGAEGPSFNTQPTEARVSGHDMEEEEEEEDHGLRTMHADGNWVNVMDTSVRAKLRKDRAAAAQDSRLKVVLPTMEEIYGVSLDGPEGEDLNTFSKHINVVGFGEHLLAHTRDQAPIFTETLDPSMPQTPPRLAGLSDAVPPSPSWSLFASPKTLMSFSKSESRPLGSRTQSKRQSRFMPTTPLSYINESNSIQPTYTDLSAKLARERPLIEDTPTPYTPVDDAALNRYRTYTALGQDGTSYYDLPQRVVYDHYTKFRSMPGPRFKDSIDRHS